MKKTFLILVAVLFIGIVNAQVTNTCLFDFSYNPAQLQSASPWNNAMSDGNQDFTDNNSVVIGHLVSTGWTSANTSGTLAPTAPAVTDFPTGTQTQDNIYGQSGAVGTITLSGLNVAKNYSFTVFGSRAGVTDNRETVYTFTGATTGNAALNPSNNTGNVAIVNNIQPTSEGVIVFTTAAGPNNVNSSKYFYLACMKMEVSNLVSTALKTVNENAFNVNYTNGFIHFDSNFTELVKVYDATGKLCVNEKALNGVLKIQLNNGLYIVKTTKGSSKLFVK